MKKFKSLLMGLVLAVLLAACTSAETEELIEYHNGFVDLWEEKGEEMDVLAQEAMNLTSIEEVYELERDEFLPIVDEIVEFVTSQSPDSDVALEYHGMRDEQVQVWSEAVYADFELLEQLANGEITEEESFELYEDVEVLYIEAEQLMMEADDKIEELSEEHDFTLEEIEE
ncbi:hypothetical protein [Alkalibacillus silvisoli]|uniref:Lipoprotein n=1 Tax=Alkalibacillus silvisoli TaxID=392823 RepID=A0ABN1A245_9BACI